MSKSSKKPTTVEDNKMTMERNKHTFPVIYNYLKSLMGKSFLNKNLQIIAKKTAETCRIPIKRNAKRKFEILICWFCENWNEVGDELIKNIYAFMYGEDKTEPIKMQDNEQIATDIKEPSITTLNNDNTDVQIPNNNNEDSMYIMFNMFELPSESNEDMYGMNQINVAESQNSEGNSPNGYHFYEFETETISDFSDISNEDNCYLYDFEN